MTGTGLRLGIFLGSAATFAFWEHALPAWMRAPGQAGRRGLNLALALLDALVNLVLHGAWPFAAAQAAQVHGWGLLNGAHVPRVPAGILSFLLLDLALYAQHLASHACPLLWRVHSAHHSDTEMDFTTALRFHPVEIVLSTLFKAVLVLLLGATPGAVLLFEIALSTGALFSHANVQIPSGWERAFRWLLVTPAMHRIHHSIRATEMDANFGFFLSVWDRGFRTFKEHPEEPLVLGLAHIPRTGLLGLLRLPFTFDGLLGSGKPRPMKAGSPVLPSQVKVSSGGNLRQNELR